MKRVLGISVLFVLFCLTIFSEDNKDIVKILLKYNDTEIIYYYELSYHENTISLSVCMGES
ncbi:hypothetical protein [Fusobacterium sp. PH5-44]|uniref:hypothetical protein n=1 Tax=unclassified Fusobacterium TaxID=2648384 RepID=UPI003D1AA50D